MRGTCRCAAIRRRKSRCPPGFRPNFLGYVPTRWYCRIAAFPPVAARRPVYADVPRRRFEGAGRTAHGAKAGSGRAAYAQIGLRAVNAVENALSSAFTAGERQGILEHASAENRRALTLEQTRYRVGASDMRAMNQQNLALYASQLSLLRIRSEQRLQRVSSYLALSGGFHG